MVNSARTFGVTADGARELAYEPNGMLGKRTAAPQTFRPVLTLPAVRGRHG